MRRFFLAIYILSVTATAWAQQPPATEQPYEILEDSEADDYDDSYENTREITPIYVDTFLYQHDVVFNPDSILALKRHKNLAYLQRLDSLLKASMNEPEPEPRQRANPGFFSALFGSGLFSLLGWLLVAFIVCVIIYQLGKNKGWFVRESQRQVVEVYEDELHPELTHDFDELIQQELARNNFRMAVRYAFLKTLKQLRLRGYIEFAIDKTNSQYLKEIPPRLKQDFRTVVHDYEYTWYGHFDINREQYETIANKFTALNSQIR